MQKVLVSACLLGDKVRYDGNCVLTADTVLQQWIDDGRVVSLCPEVSAGMSIPRSPAEISGGQGGDVLSGKVFVTDNTGQDVTEDFLTGANNALSACKRNGITVAVLTENSPSCGSSFIYSGNFTGTNVAGAGVTAALLTANGIQVFSQHQLTEANQWLLQADSFSLP